MTRKTKPCPTGCGRNRSAGYLFCRACWSSVGAVLREQLRRADASDFLPLYRKAIVRVQERRAQRGLEELGLSGKDGAP